MLVLLNSNWIFKMQRCNSIRKLCVLISWHQLFSTIYLTFLRSKFGHHKTIQTPPKHKTLLSKKLSRTDNAVLCQSSLHHIWKSLSQKSTHITSFTYEPASRIKGVYAGLRLYIQSAEVELYKKSGCILISCHQLFTPIFSSYKIRSKLNVKRFNLIF